MTRYKNPIIPGFNPDPSICRCEDDYYLVTSTFEYFPGLPIYHSRDLVHWRKIGHAIDRPEQVNLDGIRCSRGLYAATIRYHKGLFYIINTLVDGVGESGNFIVTAEDPAGEWSDPFWIDDAPGIDPSLFFDDDGKVWVCGNRDPIDGPQYHMHREIWLSQIDIEKMCLTGEMYSLWDGALKGNMACEAPHIYKKDDFYYLMVAEGGTGHQHAVTIARSDKVTGPYTGWYRNPILTHRHLGRKHPIVGVGHADLVETQNGEWWMVALGMRPYGGYHYNLGRETFLVPVEWEEGWPLVAPGKGRVEEVMEAPKLNPSIPYPEPACDNFESPKLDLAWNCTRTPREKFRSLSERPGFLRLYCRPERITDQVCSSFIGRRQQHKCFHAMTAIEFEPRSENECAGIVLLQSNEANYQFVLTRNEQGKKVVQLHRRFKGEEDRILQIPVAQGRLYMQVGAWEQDYWFGIGASVESMETVAEGVDGRILNTMTAGGFVGTYVGMYAWASRSTEGAHADFDWFEYRPTLDRHAGESV